jgi:hypothetical protein
VVGYVSNTTKHALALKEEKQLFLVDACHQRAVSAGDHNFSY